MNKEEIKYLVNQYYDNELEKAGEIKLFAALSKDEEIREYFKKHGLLKQAALCDIKHFPEKLENTILNIEPGEATNKRFTIRAENIIHALAYAAAIVFLIIALFLFQKNKSYEDAVAAMAGKITDQSEKIDLLLNSVPVVEVTPKYLTANKIIKLN